MKKTPPAVFALIAVHLCLFAYVALFRPMAFLLDDAYYSLTIAANIAGGHGITYGGFATNGFQPLYTFLMTPVYALFGANRMLCLKIALLIGACFSAASLAMLYRIANRYVGKNAATLAVALGALSTNLLIHSASGLETALHAFFFLWVVDFYTARRQSLDTKNAALFGLMLGVLAYARLDACFVFIAIGLDRFWIRRKTLRSSFVENLAIFLPAMLLLAPWFLWNLATFGTIEQSSGAFHHWRGLETQGITYALPGFLRIALVKLISLAVKLPLEPLMGYRALFLTPLTELLGTQRLAQNPILQLWRQSPGIAISIILVGIAALVLLFWFGKKATARLKPLGPLAWVLVALAGAALYYSLYQLNYSMRHFYAYSLLLSIPVAVFFLGLFRFDPDKNLLSSRTRAILIAVLVIAVFRCGPFAPGLPKGNDFGFEKVAQIRNTLPAGASVGYTDCGFYGYFLPDYRVVNLDGILNFEAQKALRENRLSQYLQEKKIGYLLALDNFHNEYRRQYETDVKSVLQPVNGADFIFRVIPKAPTP
jgi:hypothetical protein